MEAAIVAPILALLSFGAADGAWFFIQSHKLETGLTAAGSYLAQSPATTAFEANARNIAVTGQLTTGGTARVKGWQGSNVTITYRTETNSGQYRNAGDIRVARLETQLPYAGLGIISGATRGAIHLTASYETRIGE